MKTKFTWERIAVSVAITVAICFAALFLTLVTLAILDMAGWIGLAVIDIGIVLPIFCTVYSKYNS